MFNHKESLRHLLRPEHYYSEDWHRQEINQLFLPAWHLVASKSQLPKDGSFLTQQLFGKEILLRNCGGHFRAFENICSHRHCLLTKETQGHAPTIRCQYHHWEYNNEGRIKNIPEAKCFRPWDRDNSRLRTFRLEDCGDLLFVSFNNDAPPLREWLSPFYDETENSFSTPGWRHRFLWEFDCACNWKIPAENTLESYHLIALHPVTFGGKLSDETLTHHQMSGQHTALTFLAPETSRIEQAQAKLSEWLGRAPHLEHRHRHIHPSTVLVGTDTFNYALTYVPTSAQTVKIRVWMYSLQGQRRGPLRSLAAWTAWRLAWHRTTRVLNEDRTIYAQQQRGLQGSSHQGVIGCREERIYYFQKYIIDTLNESQPEQPALEDKPVSRPEATL